MSESDEAAIESVRSDVESYLDNGKPKKWYRQKRWWISGAIIIILIVAMTRCSGGADRPDYITAKTQTRSLDLTVTATGSLRPTNQVEVGSEVSGRIDRVLVDVNDKVARGQVLAIINTDVIEDQITQGRATLNSALADVAATQATLDGDDAQLGRLLEVRRLSGGRVPSAAEIDQARAAVNRGRALVLAARARVKSASAQLSTAQTQRSRAVIRSPVSGVVLARQVEPGQTVAASFNTPTLFVLAEDLAKMQLRVAVDEADVGQVEIGQKALFTVDAYPGRRFPAQVERVDLASNSIATSTQQAQSQQVVSYEARLLVGNVEGLLRPGMTATATIETQRTGKQMLVPNGALRFDPDEGKEESADIFGEEDNSESDHEARIGVGSRQTVYTIDEAGKLVERKVVTGQSDGRFTVVRSNTLRSGMDVVTGIRSKAEEVE